MSEESDILIGNTTEILKKLKKLENLEKAIIERDKIIRDNNEFLEDLKFDFKQLIKNIKEYLGDN